MNLSRQSGKVFALLLTFKNHQNCSFTIEVGESEGRLMRKRGENYARQILTGGKRNCYQSTASYIFIQVCMFNITQTNPIC